MRTTPILQGVAFALGMALLASCAGGLSASGGLKLDSKTGLSTSFSTKASASGDTKPGEPAKSGSAPELGPALDAVLSSSHRSEENRARDKYQHPKETLEFFGLRTDMKLLEVEPDADGWYTEIFAPLLKDHGTYVTTNFDPNGPAKSPLTGAAKEFQAKLDSNPELFGKVQVVTLTKDYKLGEADSVDMIVTFRNSHLWKQDRLEDRVYGEMFRVLKPGGVLGLVQHRAAAGDNPSKTFSKGYLPQPYVIERVEKAGFVFEAESHVNTNSWDTRDYPKGVWTLPPSLAMRDKDREKYLKIGESDRMTLRFRKPLASAEAKSEAVDAKTETPGPDTKAADSKPADRKATETKPPESKPADSKPAATGKASDKAPAAKAGDKVEPKADSPAALPGPPDATPPTSVPSTPAGATPETAAPAAAKASTAKASSAKPATDKSATDKPATDKPVTDKPATDKPAADKASAEKAPKAPAAKPPSAASAEPAAPPKAPEVRPVPNP